MVNESAIQMQSEVLENQSGVIFVPGWKTGM